MTAVYIERRVAQLDAEILALTVDLTDITRDEDPVELRAMIDAFEYLTGWRQALTEEYEI